MVQGLSGLMAFITSITMLLGPLFGACQCTSDPSETLQFMQTFEKELGRLCISSMPDRTRFVLTFEDDFDGDALDRNVWTGHYSPFGGTSVVRKGGYWNADLARVEDGNLILPLIYQRSGMDGGRPGWYSVGLDTDGERDSGGFRQAYGYFEVRCILPDCGRGWAAFWLSTDGVTRVGDEGMDGTEIDIFESPYYNASSKGSVTSNLHFDGYGKEHQGLGAKRFPVEGDPYSEFNTYALEWNENEYIFYINGEETLRTDFGGVSRVPEFLLLSTEMPGKKGMYFYRNLDRSKEYDFIVDYVRVFQYKELAENAGNVK